MGLQVNHLYEFGPFRLDPQQRLLLRAGEVVPLTPKLFQTLLALVVNSGQVVSKDDLLNQVWPDAVIEEHGLTQNIFLLRKALGEDADGHPYIETIPKVGYRFVAPVTEVDDRGLTLIVEQRERVRVVRTEEEEIIQQEEAARPAEPLPAASPRRNERRAGWRRGWVALCAVALLAGAIAAVAYFSSADKSRSQTLAGVRSIAVLPFKPLGADAGDDYLGLGMSDSLITRLSNLNQIIVRPTSAIRRYAGQDMDALAAGREQRVEAVLDGSIQRTGDRVRLTVQLLDVRDGSPLWAYQCNERYADIFAVQDAVAEKVAEALTLQLTGQERELLTKRHTDSVEAYQLYLMGRYHLSQFTEEGAKKALACFDKAVAADPNFAPAYAGMAHVYANVSGNYLAPAEAMRKARAAVVKALEIDDNFAEAHHAMALIKWWGDWDWPGAEAEFRRALELNPNYTPTYMDYGRFLARQERFDEAIAQAQRAREIDPQAASIANEAGRALHAARLYDRAMEEYRQALHLDPAFALARRGLARSLWQQGMRQEAIAEMEKAMEMNRDFLPDLGYLYAAAGRRSEALKILDALEATAGKKYVPPVFIAKVYAGLGDKDRAFEWLERAYQDRSDHLTFLRIETDFDGLRADPRFSDLLRRVGLAP